jgi:hypothetical protein
MERQRNKQGRSCSILTTQRDSGRNRGGVNSSVSVPHIAALSALNPIEDAISPIRQEDARYPGCSAYTYKNQARVNPHDLSCYDEQNLDHSFVGKAFAETTALCGNRNFFGESGQGTIA